MRALCLASITACTCTSTSPVAVTSIASAPTPRAAPRLDGTALRVMSYNVNFGVAGDPQAATAIMQATPHIVFLQETNDVWRDTLTAQLPLYPHHRFDPPDDWVAGGMGVMSMYPITKIEKLPKHEGPFFAWRVVVETPQGPLQVLNLHLRPPMSDGGSWVVGFFSTRGVREKEMAWHAAKLDPKLPTLIVGDFNEERDGLAIAVAERLGFADAIAQFAGKTRTWEWPVKGLTLRFQLDHIMYGTGLVATRAGIVEAGRSDHKPIWADIERAD
jgi:endonuclease/exonuclease/phosphatase (EEP) superfamily protein YafD